MGYSKSSLAIELSKLRAFSRPSPRLEQYPTDSEIAAEVLWQSYMKGDIEGRQVADLGCGTGVLGIGALLLGAAHVTFIDKDPEALSTLKENLKGLGMDKEDEVISIVETDISAYDGKADTVLQNPPFGTRDEHIDKVFLGKAIATADVTYSFHKTTTHRFVESFAKSLNYFINHM